MIRQVLQSGQSKGKAVRILHQLTNSTGPDAPPPMQGPAISSSFTTAAPPVGNVALGQGKLQEADEKVMGMLAHILGAVTSFLGPLIIWLIKKDESPFVE